jgi:ceramide glucosyltransferase
VPRNAPGVAVLVPVHGAPPGLETCLASICDQDYPQFQVIFGLHAPNDPARPVIERLIAARPGLDLALVIDERLIGANPKNCNLANMYPAAKHDVIAMIDSDVRVGPEFLARVVGAFADPAVGGVTCLYKGASVGGLASRLGALAINDWFIPSALVHLALREIDRCYGAAIIVTRQALEDIGGFEAMASAVAQDYVLGQELQRAGYRLRLAPCVVETIVVERSLRHLFRREQRWTRALRAYQPVDHALSVVTHALPIAVLLLLPQPSLLAGASIAALLVLRIALHITVRARIPIADRAAPWLVPLRECLSFLVWTSTFATSRMRWGKRRLVVTGRLTMSARRD